MINKNIWLLTWLFCCNVLLAHERDLFVKANTAFVQQQWSESVKLYQQIQSKNSFIWQNIGICFFHKQQYAQALLACKRSYIGINYHQITPILSLEREIYDTLQIRPYSWIQEQIHRLLLIIPITLLKVLFLLILCYFLFGIFNLIWHGSISRCQRKLMIVMTFFSCLFGILWYGHCVLFNNDQAIVVKKNVSLYAGPERTFHVIDKISQATLVHVIQTKNGMYQIKQNNINGWVELDSLEMIYNYE